MGSSEDKRNQPKNTHHWGTTTPQALVVGSSPSLDPTEDRPKEKKRTNLTFTVPIVAETSIQKMNVSNSSDSLTSGKSILGEKGRRKAGVQKA